MRMSFACEASHEPELPMLGHTVRVGLEQGVCPVCPGHQLVGDPLGGLAWARCPCCGSQWRLEEDGFALRPGQILEEWTEPAS
jgi:hypothetical protein